MAEFGSMSLFTTVEVFPNMAKKNNHYNGYAKDSAMIFNFLLKHTYHQYIPNECLVPNLHPIHS